MDSSIKNRPEDLAVIANSIQGKLESSIQSINDVYQRAHVISINSRIEAARVGERGRGFRIVAEEFSKLNGEIDKVATGLQEEIRTELAKLKAISYAMASDLRAQRLAQIGISVMDVVDRNLYERSCDVRWWATDSAVVAVCTGSEEGIVASSSRRLGVILDSYTVYLDIVVVDRAGKVLANGRPGLFPSQGRSVGSSAWFRKALGLASGQEYAMERVKGEVLVGERDVLVYSCPIFGQGADGGVTQAIGVLGIIFNWESLVKAVFNRVVSYDLKEDIEQFGIPTDIWIIDQDGQVLAAYAEGAAKEGEALKPQALASMLASKTQGYHIEARQGIKEILAWGYSPGFETYRSAWYCLFRQTIQA